MRASTGRGSFPSRWPPLSDTFMRIPALPAPASSPSISVAAPWISACSSDAAGGAGFRTVTTHGVALGGDRIDQRIFGELLFPLLGKGERWKRRGTTRVIETPFPFERYEQLLLNWAVTYMLSQNQYTTPVLDYIAQGGPARFKFRRLRDLIQQNYGYRVFQAIRTLKADLSHAEEAGTRHSGDRCGDAGHARGVRGPHLGPAGGV